MKTLEDIKAELQAVLADLQAIIDTPVATSEPVVEVEAEAVTEEPATPAEVPTV